MAFKKCLELLLTAVRDTEGEFKCVVMPQEVDSLQQLANWLNPSKNRDHDNVKHQSGPINPTMAVVTFSLRYNDKDGWNTIFYGEIRANLSGSIIEGDFRLSRFVKILSIFWLIMIWYLFGGGIVLLVAMLLNHSTDSSTIPVLCLYVLVFTTVNYALLYRPYRRRKYIASFLSETFAEQP